MVNDSPAKYANSAMKRLVCGQCVMICLFATQDIKSGTEIRFYFLMLSSDGLPHLTWYLGVASASRRKWCEHC